MFLAIVIWSGCFLAETGQWMMEKMHDWGKLFIPLFPESKEEKNEQLGKDIILSVCQEAKFLNVLPFLDSHIGNEGINELTHW